MFNQANSIENYYDSYDVEEKLFAIIRDGKKEIQPDDEEFISLFSDLYTTIKHKADPTQFGKYIQIIAENNSDLNKLWNIERIFTIINDPESFPPIKCSYEYVGKINTFFIRKWQSITFVYLIILVDEYGLWKKDNLFSDFLELFDEPNLEKYKNIPMIDFLSLDDNGEPGKKNEIALKNCIKLSELLFKSGDEAKMKLDNFITSLTNKYELNKKKSVKEQYDSLNNIPTITLEYEDYSVVIEPPNFTEFCEIMNSPISMPLLVFLREKN